MFMSLLVITIDFNCARNVDNVLEINNELHSKIYMTLDLSLNRHATL